MSVVEYYLLKRFPVPYGKKSLVPIFTSSVSWLISYEMYECSAILCCCGNCRCFRRTTCCPKADYCVGESFSHHLHSRFDDPYQRDFTRWVLRIRLPFKRICECESLDAEILARLLCFDVVGGVGISNMIGKIHRHEYMGFENLCKYEAWSKSDVVCFVLSFSFVFHKNNSSSSTSICFEDVKTRLLDT